MIFQKFGTKSEWVANFGQSETISPGHNGSAGVLEIARFLEAFQERPNCETLLAMDALFLTFLK